MFWYCFRERETILDLSELVTGQRMHTRYFQVGGLAEDIPHGFFPECRKFVEWMPHALDDYRGILERNEIWLERTRGIGVLSAQDAIALGQSGPNLRASGVDWDPPPRPAVPPLRPGRLPGAGLPERRRLRPLPRADGGDGGVDEDRPPVPRQARAHGGDAVDRRRPQGRAAAARGAPHLDGVPHPPLQDRHRGLPGARGRDLRRGRVAARASWGATSSPTAAPSRGGSTSARRPSSRSRPPRPACTTPSSPT